MKALIAGLAALAALAGAPVRAQQAPPPPPMAMMGGTVLEISAVGRVVRVPDVAVIEAGVTTQSASAAEAFAQANAQMAKVIAALRAAGVAERDIQTSEIQLNPQYSNLQGAPPTIVAYQATSSVTVRFREVSRAGGILDILVREGANRINGPNLVVSQREAAMDEARTDAVAQARRRAELYARAAGLRVDRILSITDTEGSSLEPRGIRMNADSADIQTGEQEVTVTVTMRFLLK